MKKSIAIPVLIFSGVVAFSAMSNAIALYTLPSNNASFGITQAIEYYLKGSFNSWSQEAEYRFVNNTNAMSPEENKIREYKLENIPLDKADELKVWADNDTWFKDGASDCSYQHTWSDSINYSAGDDHNYIVPMTSNTYSFYLKFYNDGSSKLFITANKDILYFKPSFYWKRDSATFAILQFNNDDSWAQDLTTSTESDGVYKFEIGTTYPKYKFARRNDTNTSTWNASNLQTIGNSDTNNCFELWDEYYGGSTKIDSDWDPNGNSGVWSAR